MNPTTTRRADGHASPGRAHTDTSTRAPAAHESSLLTHPGKTGPVRRALVAAALTGYAAIVIEPGHAKAARAAGGVH